MRILAAGISLSSARWKGPRTDVGVFHDYSQRYHKAGVTTGSVFMEAPENEVLAYYARLSRNQGHHLDAREIAKVPRDELLRMVLPPGGVQRFREWLQIINDGDCSSLGGVSIFDLEHHPSSKGSSLGSDWPVALRHSNVARVQALGKIPRLPAVGDSEGDFDIGGIDWRLAIPLENLAACGWHIYDGMSGSWGTTPMKQVLCQLSPFKLLSLVGNGMHLATQSSWLFYVLSLVEMRV